MKLSVSVPFRGIKNRKGKDFERRFPKSDVSVPFRGIKNRKAWPLARSNSSTTESFQSPFGELKIGKLMVELSL